MEKTAKGEAKSLPKGTVTNEANLRELGTFLDATGWRLIWGLNLGSDKLDNAVEQARAVAGIMGDKLIALEIGNEPDLFGRVRIFIIGLVGFGVASTVCGLAPSPDLLVAGRIFQGVMAAILAPQCLATVNAVFPEEERPRVLSIYGATFGLGAVVGQALGGPKLGCIPMVIRVMLLERFRQRWYGFAGPLTDLAEGDSNVLTNAWRLVLQCGD